MNVMHISDPEITFTIQYALNIFLCQYAFYSLNIFILLYCLYILIYLKELMMEVYFSFKLKLLVV